MAKINVLNKDVAVFSRNEQDYICLTDMAKYKDSKRSDYIIQNWLRNRSTIEFLGIWEHLNNPDFNPIEFDVFCFRRNWTFPEIELVCISMKGNGRCQTNGKSFHRSKKYSYCGFI